MALPAATGFFSPKQLPISWAGLVDASSQREWRAVTRAGSCAPQL